MQLIKCKINMVKLLANMVENRLHQASVLLEITSDDPVVQKTPFGYSISKVYMGIPGNLDLQKRKIAQDIPFWTLKPIISYCRAHSANVLLAPHPPSHIPNVLPWDNIVSRSDVHAHDRMFHTARHYAHHSLEFLSNNMIS